MNELQIAKKTNKTSVVGDMEININIFICMALYTHTHTHTHIYIHIHTHIFPTSVHERNPRTMIPQ